MDPITTSGWKGIDNTHSDVELAPDVLRNSSNIDFSPSGKLRSRHGYALLSAGAARSGFAFGPFLIYVRNAAAEAFDPRSGAIVALFPVQGARLGHVVIDGHAYVSDGVSKWVIDPLLGVSNWPTVSPDDPTFDARFVADFPASTKLAYFKGCLIGKVGNVVVYSLPYVFGSMNPAAGFYPVRGDIKVMCANEDTLFIGADEIVAFDGLGDALTAFNVVNPVTSIDGEPAYDKESGASFWMTTRGAVTVARKGSDATLVSTQQIAFRPASQAALGLVRRDGAISLVASCAPDTSSVIEHPLVAEDFSKSETIRKEIYDAL